MPKNLPLPASTQDGTYPRPQLVRVGWRSLEGPWQFGYGELPDEPPQRAAFDRSILVPFPPESPASGIGDTGYHPVLWYRHTIDADDLAAAGVSDDGHRVLLHFGAVDWAAEVWLNDIPLGRHQGGQSPFSFDITSALSADGPNTLVVRAVDDPHDVSIPRGKQDWHEQPHAIWYHRTSGIWQPVWLEAVPRTHVTDLNWQADILTGTVRLGIGVSGLRAVDTWVQVELSFDGEPIAATRMPLSGATSDALLAIDRMRNGQEYEELLWSADHPRLIDATITILEEGRAVDTVTSYLGLRSITTRDRQLLINDHPTYLRSVLAQNYWPQSHLAAPAPEALRREVELIKELGFNAARIHQKAEDPRFLYWADRLGLMLWAETANAYEFTDSAVAALTTEWMDLVRRDRSHPCIITWVPLNESWGVPRIAHDARQQAYSRTLADLTRTIDGSRPVISNDGWEHTSSDIWTIHDYDAPDRLSRRYATAESVGALLHGIGPVGRRISVGQDDEGQPVMLTEFGGISYDDTETEGAWGYRSTGSPEQLRTELADVFQAVQASPVLVGFCYTQLTDTGQETNGLLRADRTPKIPPAEVRRIVLGE